MAVRWQLDGVVLPRNPDVFSHNHDKANVTYVKMADGSQRRIIAPNLLTASDLHMEWSNADQRTRSLILGNLNDPTKLHKLTLDQILPAQQVWAYLDTPNIGLAGSNKSGDGIIDTRTGQGGVRWDIKLDGRTDGPYNHSLNPVPVSGATAASVAASFGGPLGNPALDGLPTWNGNQWKQLFGSAASSASFSFSNLGNAPWSPTIRLNGPFATGLTITAAYQDVDGTGAGVKFTYNGANIAAGDYLLFDTQKLRLYTVVSSAQNESYAFSVNTVSNALAFPYWPPLPTGSSSLSLSWTGADTSNAAIDLSNNGTESFRYW